MSFVKDRVVNYMLKCFVKKRLSKICKSMMSNSKIFFTRILTSVLSSLLFTYVTGFLLSLRMIFNFSFRYYFILYVPATLIAVTAIIIVMTRKYITTNVPSTNRFYKIIKGLSIQTLSLAALCSGSACFLVKLNPYYHDEKHWYLLNMGCALAGVVFHYENICLEQDFHFPIIQTNKYSMFMSKLSEIIFKSIKKSFLYTFFIFILLFVIEPNACTAISFFINLWFSIALILYLFYSYEHIVYLIMTERVIFPIFTLDQDSDSLLKALNADNKTIKSLALYDLYQASINDSERRKEIFSLSFAGNISQSWKIIFNYCVNNIKFTMEDMANLVKQVSPKIISHRKIPNARLIKLNDNNSNKQDEEDIGKQSKLIKFLETFFVYNYFFGPLDKIKTLEEFERTVWCCYILSNLTAVSLEEDEYGVVREQLGQIVSTILDLNNKLEHQKIHFNSQKTRNIEYLKIHVRTCAIMLALKLSRYANDIGLDENHLHSFKKIISLLNNS